MKKKMILFLLLAALLLSACGTPHVHDWENATCTEPETCADCGETRGRELGHLWQSAGCTEPETCARCGETRGEATGHDWQAATCTEPETCARCGETRGEALGHDWLAATCTEPETCARCGETRGEALGHDAAPADYWSPSVCSRCGEQLEGVLTPDFVAYGLDARIVGLNKTVSYKTLCYDDNSYSTVGKLTFTDYQTTRGNGEDLELRDGYDWRILNLQIVFDDENANNYGISISYSHEDYYDVHLHDDTLYYDSDGTAHFDVVYKGVTYHCKLRYTSSFSDWSNGERVYTGTAYAQLPVGYDGLLFGLCDRGLVWPEGAYVTEVDNSGITYFRMG